MIRIRYSARRVVLRTAVNRDFAVELIRGLPLDEAYPLEMVVREHQPKRSLDQNALMWAGPLKDISSQVSLDTERGKMKFSAEAWHGQFKEWFLPDELDAGFDESLVRPGYRKYEYLPDGSRMLVGSTTDLTKKGFSWYLEQVYAYGAEQGVLFGERA